MKKQKIKAIIFDLGGVITYGGYLAFIHHYIGQHLSPQTKRRIEHLERQLNLENISELEFYKEIQKEFHVHLKPKQMHDKIVKKMRTNKSLVAYIPKLKQAKIALFSNSLGHIAVETLASRHLTGKKLFDRVFLSNVMHLAKPEAKAYHYVTKHLKVKPSEALMVDDRAENIRGAKRVGMQGIVFKNTSQFKRELKKYTLV